jgi:hypothetical protein
MDTWSVKIKEREKVLCRMKQCIFARKNCVSFCITSYSFILHLLVKPPLRAETRLKVYKLKKSACGCVTGIPVYRQKTSTGNIKCEDIGNRKQYG